MQTPAFLCTYTINYYKNIIFSINLNILLVKMGFLQKYTFQKKKGMRKCMRMMPFVGATALLVVLRAVHMAASVTRIQYGEAEG